MPDIAFATPFDLQVEFLEKKLNLPTDTWLDIWQHQHDTAFVVAGATKADLLADLHAAVNKAAAQGTTLEEFRKDFKRTVAKHGWTGWTGEGSKAGEAWRTKVIYQTNMATSYAAGRWAQINDPDLADFRPYIQYHHADGVMNPRPHHVAWNGLVLPKDHPFWKTHAAPNGWGCHCYLSAASPKDYAAAKAKGKAEPPEGWDAIDQKTDAPIGIDKGWGYSPGASRAEELQKFAAEKAGKLPAEIAKDFKEDAAKVGAGGMKWPAAAPAVAADNAGMPADQAIRAALASPAFDEFFHAAKSAPARFAVAALVPEDRALFGCKGDTLWLSRHSLDEHKERHPEVVVDDYRVIPDIVQRGEVWAGHSPNRYLLLWLGGKPYRAAIKVDAKGEEAWFLSLVVSGKQKPPKGAVKIR